MKILVGLGNPGEKYKNNRHSVGYLFIDFLKSHPEFSSGSRNKFGMTLAKTDCFMNTSGLFIEKLIRNSKLVPIPQNRESRPQVGKFRNLVVVHDDLDIPFGKFKIQLGTGPKLHNGILSIEDELGTNDFWRVRIGVDNRGENKVDGETYSLQDFTNEELKQLQPIFEKVYKQLALIIK